MPVVVEIVASSLNLAGTIVLAMDPMFAGRRAAATAGWIRFTGELAAKGRKPPAEVDQDGKPVPEGNEQLVTAAAKTSARALRGLFLIGLGFLVQLLAALYKAK